MDPWVKAQLDKNRKYKAAMAKRQLGDLVQDGQKAIKSGHGSLDARLALVQSMLAAVDMMTTLPSFKTAATGTGLKMGSKYKSGADGALATIVEEG